MYVYKCRKYKCRTYKCRKYSICNIWCLSGRQRRGVFQVLAPRPRCPPTLKENNNNNNNNNTKK